MKSQGLTKNKEVIFLSMLGESSDGFLGNNNLKNINFANESNFN